MKEQSLKTFPKAPIQLQKIGIAIIFIGSVALLMQQESLWEVLMNGQID